MIRLFIFIVLITTLTLQAQEQLSFSGKVNSSLGKGLDQVKVEIGGQSFLTNSVGEFDVALKSFKPFYQLKISKPGFYPSIHTFSHAELKKAISLENITLIEKKAGRVMLAFGGDVMMGRRFYKPYFGDDVLIEEATQLADMKDIVKHIKPYMEIADYAAVNLETQLASQTPKEKAPKSVVFYTKPDILAALEWAGIDYVSLGNNHTYDYLDSGLETTLAALKKSNLGYSGAGKDEKQALQAFEQDIKQQPFSMFGYVGWEGSASPNQTAGINKGGAAFGSSKNIVDTVTSAIDKKRHSIVQYHGSQEYADEPTGVTEQRLKTAIDNGASLAIAHHPHVAQGLELYKNQLIAYSMGNFIFDQNFASTMHSLVLYVWLDEGKFHHAEIVPVYVQGYKPTPATGSQRVEVLNRLTTLSKYRATHIVPTGAHGMITKHNTPSLSTKMVVVNSKNATAKLPQTISFNEIKSINSKQEGSHYRLGQNLVNGSDFSRFLFEGEKERGFLYDRDNTEFRNKDGLQFLDITTDDKSLFGMQSFRRVYRKSTPVTVNLDVKVTSAAKVKFYWQGRKTRQKLFDAFENSPKHLIGEFSVEGSTDWQTLSADFNSPRIGYKSYRVLVELISESGSKQTFSIDNFEAIEWLTAYTDKSLPVAYSNKVKQATHIGVNADAIKEFNIQF